MSACGSSRVVVWIVVSLFVNMSVINGGVVSSCDRSCMWKIMLICSTGCVMVTDGSCRVCVFVQFNAFIGMRVTFCGMKRIDVGRVGLLVPHMMFGLLHVTF